MLALSDPFSHNSAIDSLGSQMTLPTSQAATQFQSLQQATIQEQQQAQSILYSNGSVPNIGELQQQQQMQPASYTNGTIPMTGELQQFQHQMRPTLYPNGIIPTMGAPQQLQQQMQPALYSDGTISSMGAPLQQQQQMQPGVFPNGSMPSMGAGSQSLGPLPPAPWDMQSMQNPQPMVFAYGQQADVQFGDQRRATCSLATPDDISRKTQGLSLEDDGYTSFFQGSSASYLQQKKPSKAEDKLFGDLVSIAKTKSKPSSTPTT
ncbi:TOM1-like protein 9 [Nymphaea colorata]|nr:TOM1-like protein 9 [Nymphaea colorata]